MASNMTGDDIATCGVCLEDMKTLKPRLLSCHHSFCESCMQHLVKSEKITCPTCRTVTKVSDNDVSKLSINFFLLQILDREKSKETTLCQLCCTEKAANFCEACSDMICKEHNKVQHFKDHVISELCKDHYKVITHICFECCTTACFKCVMSLHREHEVHEYSHELHISHREKTHKYRQILDMMDLVSQWQHKPDKKIKGKDKEKDRESSSAFKGSKDKKRSRNKILDGDLPTEVPSTSDDDTSKLEMLPYQISPRGRGIRFQRDGRHSTNTVELLQESLEQESTYNERRPDDWGPRGGYRGRFNGRGRGCVNSSSIMPVYQGRGNPSKRAGRGRIGRQGGRGRGRF